MFAIYTAAVVNNNQPKHNINISSSANTASL